MSIIENISLAFTSLFANKMRALLTMLGIIIGIGSVIAIITLGDSLTGSITSNMQSMGANNVTVMIREKEKEGSNNNEMSSAMMGSGGSGKIAEKNLISKEMMQALAAEFPEDVQAIVLSDSVGSGRTTEGRNYANLSLSGVNSDYAIANNVTVNKGRFINERDIEGAKKVAVVSDKLVKNMFSNTSPIGKQISINVSGHTGDYTIIGVYKYQSGSMGMVFTADRDTSTEVYIPISTANKITGTEGYYNISVLTRIGVDSAAFADKAAVFMDRFYTRNKDYGITTFSMDSILDAMKDMLNTMQIAIAAIAAISLLVGGIGVMNIMLVSITERTREIGTRKALGATNGEIRIQFIVEAVIICLVGGIIGIALGVALGMGGAALLGTPARPSVGTMLLASGFSMVIGVFFGYYPANKAAKLDPIDALRYE